MFFLKKRALAAAALCAALVLMAGFCLSAAAAKTLPAFRVVIDAGHGGADPGVCGAVTGIRESEVNLAVALRLAEYLEGAGIAAVLTRSGPAAPGEATGAGSFKQRDMLARKAVIEAAAPNAVVSVHQNSFPADRTRRGGQVFFREGAAAGQALAGSIQARLNALSGGTFSPLRGDYFMLNCTNYPSVIVECGFLSNPEDERLLSDENYRAEVAYAVFCGVLAFLA